MGIRTLMSKINNSPSNSVNPGMGESLPNIYSIFSNVANPNAPDMKYTKTVWGSLSGTGNLQFLTIKCFMVSSTPAATT